MRTADQPTTVSRPRCFFQSLLVDDGILLCEPGAEVSLSGCVQLVLGHLVPLSGPLWQMQSQLMRWCDPLEPEHYDVGRNGEPEDDGACQQPGVVEKALVELALLQVVYPGSHQAYTYQLYDHNFMSICPKRISTTEALNGCMCLGVVQHDGARYFRLHG